MCLLRTKHSPCWLSFTLISINNEIFNAQTDSPYADDSKDTLTA